MLDQNEGSLPLDTSDGQTNQDAAGSAPDDKQISALRSEAAKWRVQYREAEKTLKELQPLIEKAKADEEAQKSDIEKFAAKLSALENERDAFKSQADAEAKRNKLIVLAAKAGVPIDVVQFLDINQFNLEEEDDVVKALSALAHTKPVSTGKPANPGSPDGSAPTSEDDLKDWYYRKSGRNIFFGG